MSTPAAVDSTIDLLTALVGEWEGSSRTWLEPGKLTDDSPIRARIRRIGDTPFLLHEYDGAFDGEPREGIEIIGLNLVGAAGAPFLSVWVDSWHMSRDIQVSRGDAAPGGFAVLGDYASDHRDPKSVRWGWRTHLEVHDPDHLTFTAYNISPDGREAKATETVYTRRT